MNSHIQQLATAVVASTVFFSYGVEATIQLTKRRADTLTRQHQMELRRQGVHGHQLGQADRKMIYPQSMTSKIARWMGLYGTIQNADNTPVTLTNTLDITWTGNLLIADDEQSVPVIFDTSSHLTVVEGCTSSCTAGLDFDTSAATNYNAGSTAFSETYSTNVLTGVTYAGATGGGDAQVCWDSNSQCEAGVKFYASDTVTNNPYTAVGGYAGLALGKGDSDAGVTPVDGDMLLYQISNAPATAEPEFVFNYGSNGNDSFLDLGTGTFDSSKVKTVTTLGVNNVSLGVKTNSYYWELKMKGVRFSANVEDEWGFVDTTARIDSSQQCITAPSNHYKLIREGILKYSTGYYSDPVYGIVVDCYQENWLNDLEFLLEGYDSSGAYWTTASRFDYLSEIDNSYECQVCIRDSGSEDDTWTLGVSWMAGYVAHFDRTNDMLNLQLGLNGQKDGFVAGSTPNRLFGINYTIVGGLAGGIGACWIVFIILCAFAFCYLFRTMLRSSPKKRSQQDELVEKLETMIQLQSQQQSSSGNQLI